MKKILFVGMFLAILFTFSSAYGAQDLAFKTLKTDDGSIKLVFDQNTKDVSGKTRPILKSATISQDNSVYELQNPQLRYYANWFSVSGYADGIYIKAKQTDSGYFIKTWNFYKDSIVKKSYNAVFEQTPSVLTPITPKPVAPISATPTKSNLVITYKQDVTNYWNENYDIYVKVFDKSINTNPKFDDFEGLLKDAIITVSVTDKTGKLKQITGNMDAGQWHGQNYFAENISMPGTYLVTINSELANSKNSIQTEMNLIGVAANRVTIPDSIPPNTILNTKPANPSNDSTFTFSSDDQFARFECKIDSGAWTACTSPKTYTLTDGAHTFSVRAVDPAGNIDSTPESYTWTLDITPPNTILNTNPTNPSNDVTPTFEFSSDDSTATFECKIDSEEWTACTSPKDYTLALGAHTFSVRALDSVGNIDSTPESYTWTIN